MIRNFAFWSEFDVAVISYSCSMYTNAAFVCYSCFSLLEQSIVGSVNNFVEHMFFYS